MENMENTVAMQEKAGMEVPADDAQAAEVSVEELVAQFTQGNAPEETVENEGDNGQNGQETEDGEQPEEQENSDKFGRRIAAALRSQERTLIAEIGGCKLSKAEITEIIREHQARKMSEEDPEISQKAARKILEAQDNAAKPEANAKVAELTATMKDMISKGYTPEEIRTLISDKDVRADVESGKNLWQAARAYERRRSEAAEQPARKRAPRTARSTAAGGVTEPNLIETIPEDKFDDFLEELRRRAMRGEKVRI